MEIDRKIDLKGTYTNESGSDHSDQIDRIEVKGKLQDYNIHDLDWTPEEEKRIVRIFDLKILGWVGVMCTTIFIYIPVAFFFCDAIC